MRHAEVRAQFLRVGDQVENKWDAPTWDKIVAVELHETLPVDGPRVPEHRWHGMQILLKTESGKYYIAHPQQIVSAKLQWVEP